MGDWPAGGLEQGRNIGFNGGAGKVDNGIKTIGDTNTKLTLG